VTRLLLVWVHVVAAALWLGGLLQAVHLLVPALARGERGLLAVLLRGRAVTWAAFTVLLATGLANLQHVGLTRWLALKVLLALGALSVAAHRDFALLPAARAALGRGVEPAAALRRVRLFDRVLAVLGLAIVFLAAGVARGR
jgi:hypothetical protein